jgi:hypothetical protein
VSTELVDLWLIFFNNLLPSASEVRESLCENVRGIASQVLYDLSGSLIPQPTVLFGDLLKTSFNDASNHSTLHLR